MIRAFLARRGAALATVLAGVLVVALIAVISLVSTGYRADKLSLDDDSVWVTNQSRQAIGRANVRVGELNAALAVERAGTGATGVDVVQDASTVLLVDRAAGSVGRVDLATATVDEPVPLPPGASDVHVARGRVVIARGGDLWLLPTASLEDFRSDDEPTVSLGADALTAVAPTGDIFVYRAETGRLSHLGPGSDRVDDATTIDAVATDTPQDGGADSGADGGADGAPAVADSPGALQLTATGDRYALLDRDAGLLHTPSGQIDLADIDGLDVATAVVQQPSAARDGVLVATAGSLVDVSPSGAGRVLATGAFGPAVAPASTPDPAAGTVGECLVGAWQSGTVASLCGRPSSDDTARVSTVSGMVPGADLAFRVLEDRVVLNDRVGGGSWAVLDGNRSIDNWDDLLADTDTEEQVEENTDDTPPEFDEEQKPPVAVADSLGARPGRSTLLPVLLNDYDPNGDVLVIDGVGEVPTDTGRVDLVNDGQSIKLTLSPEARGDIRFAYSISDGRGGTATADVTVTVRGDDENGPPAQVRPTRTTVAAGGRVSTQVLGDWVDPDGDPLYLTRASVDAPDLTQFTPAGEVVYTDGGTGAEARDIPLLVSDGRAEGAGVLAVSIKPSGQVPIIADGFAVTAYAGEDVRIAPLDHARGGSAPLRLVNVPSRDGSTVVPDYDLGTFRFTSGEARTHLLEYTVTDGVLTETGQVRIDVLPNPTGAAPVTVPHTAFVREQSSQDVAVLEQDFDPAGGVLVVTGVDDAPVESGIRVEVVEQRLVRITLTRPLEAPTPIGYHVSNGTAESDGTITVIQVPTPAVRQAPIANPDTASVRVGDAIDIPVLANDRHPDGDALTLDATLSRQVPANAGLLFASGTVLRYLAPREPGNYTATYRVRGPDGQWADADLTLTVREADAAGNRPPVPKTVTSRVLAGDTVRVPIPLQGIDPDGDSVKLAGQASNPEKGAVTASGIDWFEYEAGAYSTGTDEFSYTVVDTLGQTATGTVRIGISPPRDGARNPVATSDEVTTRPGRTITVRPLDNDSDPDGDTLTITGVTPTTPGATAEVRGSTIRVTVPDGRGRYGFVYDIENGRGGTASTFLTVVADPDAPAARPLARDTVLSLSDIQDADEVTVNPLKNVFFAEGEVSSLDLTIPGDFAQAARVTGSKRVVVAVTNESQIIPFVVAHPDDADVTATAFIWVPGKRDAVPQLKAGVKPISVTSGESVDIRLADYVIAPDGRDVRLTDTATVRATHADGSALTVDDRTLRFRSAEGYFGPASISFEVTDSGGGGAGGAAKAATLVLPIDVVPTENQPPVFTGGQIDFEPGQSKDIDLTKLTRYPYADDLDQLAFSVLDPRATGFDVALSGSTLTVTARADTPKGAASSALIGVRDTANPGQNGRLDLRVVASTRPLAQPATDQVIAPRGQTTTVNVLQNDQATNPFPGEPLTVVAVRGADGQNVPAGVSITPSADRSTLSIQVSGDAAARDTTVQYQVADATGDPARHTWGTVRISVQDTPDPVSAVRVTGFDDRGITVTWVPGAANNASITGFRVGVRPAGGGAATTTACAATTCRVPTPGNGSDNAVTLEVVAENSIGASTPTGLAERVWSDVIPAAPAGITAEPLDGGLRIGWDAVSMPSGASPVRTYVVTVGGRERSIAAAGSCSGGRCTTEVQGLPNGSRVDLTISARNDAYPALSKWNSAAGQGTPFGAPSGGGVRADGDSGSGSVTVSWSGFGSNGDPIAGYFVERLANGQAPTGSGACRVSSPAPGTVTPPVAGGSVVEVRSEGAGASSTVFTGLDEANKTYFFAVWAYNRAGCAVSNVTEVRIRPTPGDAPRADGAMVETARSTYDYRVTNLQPRADRYQIATVDAAGNRVGAWVAFATGAFPREVLELPTGQRVQFALRACNVYAVVEVCGDPAVMTAPETSLAFRPVDLRYDGAAGAYSWTALPSNGPDYPATALCVDQANPENAGISSATGCSFPAPPVDPALFITIGGKRIQVTP
jgi:hypothetical protein